MIEQIKSWDRELFIWLNSLGIESYDAFWVFVTQIESWIPLFILFFVLIIYFHKWKKGLVIVAFVLVTFGITLLFTDLTKEFIGRLRPNNNEQFAGLIRILQKPTTYSFFSGHASSSFAITTFIFLSLRKHTFWIVLAFIWPLLFVLSRIYVGVHYPSDIFIGTIVGILMALIFYSISKYVLGKFYFLSEKPLRQTQEKP